MVSFEVRPRPDVAVSFWVCFFFRFLFVGALAVLSLGLLCVCCYSFSDSARHGAAEGTENRGCLFFFLVQYAVHKSLALEIIQLLLNFFCC